MVSRNKKNKKEMSVFNQYQNTDTNTMNRVVKNMVYRGTRGKINICKGWNIILNDIVIFNMFHTHFLFLYGHLNQFLPKNLVGRFILHNRGLGRIMRFYNPDYEEALYWYQYWYWYWTYHTKSYDKFNIEHSN